MILRALDVLPEVLSEAVEVVLVIVVWTALFFLLSVVGSLSTKMR
jgi:hypothetical protein